jgi:hypothetical protein
VTVLFKWLNRRDREAVLTEAALAKKRTMAEEMRAGLEELRSNHGTFSDSAAMIREDRDSRG